MSTTSEVQSQISKRVAVAIGGNLSVTGNSGVGAATAVVKHQISSVASIEFMASAGLHSLIGVQTTRFELIFCLGLFCHLTYKSLFRFLFYELFSFDSLTS